MTKLIAVAEKSRVRVHTFAEGMLARLAHDLELLCGGLSGSATRAADGAAEGSLTFPLSAIELSGTLKGGRLDPRGLSASDRGDVLAKMRRDVFHVTGGDAAVRVEAHVESSRARVRLLPPNGRAVERSTSVRVEPEGGGVRVSGVLTVSLSELGSRPVKGPMNAFRVKDDVEVLFEVVFTPEGG